MSNDISVTSDGTITASVRGAPEQGGNANNHLAFSVAPGKQRVGLSTGLGASLDGTVGNGVRLIGAAGAKLRMSANVGVSADRAERQHDSTYDSPLRPDAIGIREARQIGNKLMSIKNGDIRQYSVGEVEGVIAQHPNLLKPSSRQRFESAMDRLDGVNTGGLASSDTLQRLERIAEQLRSRGIEIDPIPAVPIISAGDVLRTQTLTQINNAASQTQQAITRAGGVEGIATTISDTIGRLPPAVRDRLPADLVDDVRSVVSDISQHAGRITSQYESIPSPERVREIKKLIDTHVKYDPEVQVSAFAAGGVMMPSASAAVVVQKAAQASVGNVDWVAGDGIKVHPAKVTTMRAEIGTAGTTGLSDDTAQKLNLALNRSSTSVGAYAFLEREQVRWKGLDASRTTTAAGVGANMSKPLGGGKVGSIGIEAYSAHVEQVTPGDLPAKSHDKGGRITGKLTF